MIVAGERQYAAVPLGAGRIGVLQGVDRAVDTRSLAVPDAEYAIDLGARKQSDLLAAPHRGRSQILVQARNEGDILRLQEGFGAPQRVIVDGPSESACTPFWTEIQTLGLCLRYGSASAKWPPVCSSLNWPTRNVGTLSRLSHGPGARWAMTLALRPVN